MEAIVALEKLCNCTQAGAAGWDRRDWKNPIGASSLQRE
jgi:hypothetical protein